MKKVFLLLLFLIPLLSFSQNKETRAKLAGYKANGVYTVENNNIVVRTTLIDVKGTKDDLYAKAKNYIERVYNDHNSTLKVADKQAGVLENESVLLSFYHYTVNDSIPVSYHIFYTLRVEAKSNGLHITCLANNGIAEWSTAGFGYHAAQYNIMECVPLGEREVFSHRNATAEAFIALVDRLQKVIDDLAKGVRE